jgi:hypothetical protein
MKTPEPSLQELQNELNHIYQRIDFRDEKYNEHCEEWKESEQGVMYLEKTIKLQILSKTLKSNINKIESQL